MGEVSPFPTVKFRVQPPARRLSPMERHAAAYDLVSNAEVALRDNNTPASGYRIIARASVVRAAYLIGAEATKRWLTELAGEIDHHLSSAPPPGGAA